MCFTRAECLSSCFVRRVEGFRVRSNYSLQAAVITSFTRLQCLVGFGQGRVALGLQSCRILEAA